MLYRYQSQRHIFWTMFSTEKCLARSMPVFGYSHDSTSMQCVKSFYFWGREMSVTMFSWHKIDIKCGMDSLPFFVFKYSYQTAWENKEHQDLSLCICLLLWDHTPIPISVFPQSLQSIKILFSSPYLDGKQYVQAWNGVFWLFCWWGTVKATLNQQEYRFNEIWERQ